MDDNNESLEEVSEEQLNAVPEDTAIVTASELHDPSQAVDGMLDAALQQVSGAEHEQPYPSASFDSTQTTAAIEYPFYSILVKSLTPLEKETLGKRFEKNSYGCSYEDLKGQIEQSHLHLSQLSEMQMIGIAHELYQHSIHFDAQPHWDNTLQLETPNTQITEAAASVALLPIADDVLLLNAKDLQGHEILQVMGPVLSHKSIARKFFRSLEQEELLEKELRKIKREKILQSLLPKSGLEKCFQSLFSDIRRAALSVGANAVLDLKIEFFPESSSRLDPEMDQMRIVLSGTASVLEKTAL